MNKKHYGAVIFYNFKSDLNYKEFFKQTSRELDDKSCFFATEKRWYNEFQRGRRFLNDGFLAPKPKMVITSQILILFGK